MLMLAPNIQQLHPHTEKGHNDPSTHLWQKLRQKRLYKSRTQQEVPLCVLSSQPDELNPRPKRVWSGQKERQSKSKLLLLCLIGGEGRLQTPRSSTKYEITSKLLTRAAALTGTSVTGRCSRKRRSDRIRRARMSVINNSNGITWLIQSNKRNVTLDVCFLNFRFT